MHSFAEPKRAYLALLSSLGLIGLVGLVYWTLQRPLQFSAPLLISFWVLGTLTRVMAFPRYRSQVIAFDSAYYIAAGIVLGWEWGAWIVVATLATDTFVQPLRQRVFSLPRLHSRERLARFLYNTFGNALLLLLVGALLDMLELGPHQVNRHTAVFVTTPIALIAFIVGHYHISFLAALLNGAPARKTYLNFTLAGILGESLLTPLAMVMVLVYQASDLAPFTLLAITILVINAGFFIAAWYGQKLQDRVRELSVLNRVARALGRDLELDPLLVSLCAQLHKHFPPTDAVAIGLRDISSGVTRCFFFTERGEHRGETSLSTTDGLIERVMSERRSLRMSNLSAEQRTEDPALILPDARSWLGVPLVVNQEVIGFFALQSRQRRAFSRADEQLLGQLSSQAAIAFDNARLFRLATVDGLTGLFVRRYFDQRLEEECHRAERYKTAFSLFMMDLDDFKQINDTRGHTAGDLVLQATARIVRSGLRNVDIAARYGGEEFVALLPRTETDVALQVAERIRAAVAANVIGGATGAMQVTISIGVATFPGDGADATALVKQADRALYKAKHAGKNRVAVV